MKQTLITLWSTSSYKIFGKDTTKLNYLLKDGPKSNKIAKMEIDHLDRSKKSHRAIRNDPNPLAITHPKYTEAVVAFHSTRI